MRNGAERSVLFGEHGRASQTPRISVIIATYNSSSVLRFAVASVLAQTFDDFELIVIGDCCTDDSAEVVRSFRDQRVHWHNLPENCGSQFGPNNRGLGLARGEYVAYLGHDDLWHPEHLATLFKSITSERADLVFGLTEYIGPPQKPTRRLMGLAPNGVYEWSMWAPPSSWLHRRELIDRVGAWRDHMTIVLPTDVDFLNRIHDAGCRIIPVVALTTFKFPSMERTKSYVNRRAEEQATWWRRICDEPELRHNELIYVLKHLASQQPNIVTRFVLPGRARAGSLTASYRAQRGLVPVLDRGADLDSLQPLFTDRSTLKYLNNPEDIVPTENLEALHKGGELPEDGLYVGANWYSLEIDVEDPRKCWRWMDRAAEIVITKPSGKCRRLLIDLMLGPGIVRLPCKLLLRDATEAVLSEASIDEAGVVQIELPNISGEGAVLTLDTEDGGRSIRGDPRILNFRISGLRLMSISRKPDVPINELLGLSADELRQRALERDKFKRSVLLARKRSLRGQLQESEADRAARLEQINILTNALKESEADRAARLEQINILTNALKESEADRAARLEQINILTNALKKSEAERAADLNRSIFRLMH
jgi:GT2 family glycosyltransferase